MSRYDYLLGKAKEIVIGNDKFQVKQLSTRELSLFMDDKANPTDVAIDMIVYSLKQSDETITREDIENLPMGVFQEISQVIMEINELNKK